MNRRQGDPHVPSSANSVPRNTFNSGRTGRPDISRCYHTLGVSGL